MKVLLVLCLWYASIFRRIAATLISSSANVKPSATRGMVIDAGSGGSRLHVYSWLPRIFSSIPPPLSFPEANEQFTARMDPGIALYADNPMMVKNHLAPLIDFAKAALIGRDKEFGDYPIFFKATGGMRELPQEKRDRIIEYVRMYLSDKSFCPFFFRNDFARVISGSCFFPFLFQIYVPFCIFTQLVNVSL
jgi:hypothetical protein